MTKMIIGFVLGIAVASAGAQVMDLTAPVGAYLNAGVSPDSKAAPIRVDQNGYVICSTERR